MLELLVEICLVDRPSACADRLLPGACVEAAAASRAEAWAAARLGLVAGEARCVETAAAVEPLDVVEVAPGNFVHPGRHELPDAGNLADQANVGFVVGDAAVAVIDAGGSRAVGERLYAAIRARTDLPIRWLVITHMHPDHVFGASVFAEAGATVVGHERLPAALGARAASYRAALVRAAGPVLGIGSGVVMPDEVVGGSREIDLGGRTLLLEAHPTAHTDNDLTVLDRRTGTWWLGDLVFDTHAPAVDGSILGWLALLDRLAERDAERIVPGHGGPALGWPGGAAPLVRYLEALVAETRAAIAAGESLGEATRHVGTSLRADWLLFDAFNARNATAAYTELEWE